MPQFYWFTFIGSALFGYLIREYMINFDNNLVLWMVVLLFLIYLNEKTAIGEDLIDAV